MTCAETKTEEKARRWERKRDRGRGREGEMLLFASVVRRIEERGRMCPLQARLSSWCDGKPGCYHEPPVHNMPVLPLKHAHTF